MPCKAGKITLPAGGSSGGAGGFAITGLGFQPDCVIFCYVDMTAEDTWVVDTTGMVQGGMGFSTWKNSDDHSQGLIGSMTGQVWQNGNTSNTTNQAIHQYVRSDISTALGYATGIVSFDADGFHIRYANTGTFYDGRETGKILYYLAIGGRKSGYIFSDIVGSDAPDTTTKTLGWEPKGLVSVGGSQTFYLGNSYDAYAFRDFNGDFSGLGRVHSLSKAFGLRESPTAGLDVSIWGEEDSAGVTDFYDYDASGFWQPANPFQATYVPSPTNLQVTLEGVPGGFDWSPTNYWMMELILGAAEFELGTFNPSNTVDSPQTVTTSIAPEAFIFVSQPTGVAINDPAFFYTDHVYYGHTTIGFLTPTFQCCVSWGGSLLGHAASFQSSTKCWVSNYSDTLPFGSAPTLGEATMTDHGFTHTTKQNAAADDHRVLWWGIGDLIPADYQDMSFSRLFSPPGSR